MKDIKYIKMGESEIVLSYDSKTKLISVDVCSSLGNINCNVEGSIFGKVRVDIVGKVGGNIYGDVDGKITGDIWDNVEGSIFGHVFGVVEGNAGAVRGNLGELDGEVVGFDVVSKQIRYNDYEEQEDE